MIETRWTPISETLHAEAGMRNVLVVDDEEAVRDLMAYVLECQGYTVFKARHSRDAMYLQSEFAGTLHLLLTDICMKPHDDGFTLARLLRNERPEIKVIYASGYVDQDKLRDELRKSPACFLAKPFTPAALIDAVRAVLAVEAHSPA